MCHHTKYIYMSFAHNTQASEEALCVKQLGCVVYIRRRRNTIRAIYADCVYYTDDGDAETAEWSVCIENCII